MKHICKQCGKEFIDTKKRVCCSIICSNKYRWTNKDFIDKMDITRSNPDYIKRMTTAQRKAQSNIETNKLRSKTLKITNKLPDVYERRSNASLKKWLDDKYRDKILNNENLYNKKLYEFPSGKQIQVQGYETFALNELLKEDINESDIIAGSDLIKSNMHIVYKFENKNHCYIPDIYVKSTNTIIEVKSQYTYEKDFEVNQLKRNACIDNGYNFEFRIYEIVDNLPKRIK